MQDYNFESAIQRDSGFLSNVQIDLQPLMRLVYMWMGLGLLVTAGVSYLVTSAVYSNPELLSAFATGWIILLVVQLGIVFGLSWAINRISPTMALGLFFVYAATMGVTLGAVFFGITAEPVPGGYAPASEGLWAIAKAFATTAGLFGVMTVIGYTTKIDLSKFGTFLLMALIGLIIASVVNIFMQSTMLDFIISAAGVLIFTALTAYDTQKIKRMAAMPEMRQKSDAMTRLSIMGALTLYLDFINLFMYLLRIFAGNRD
ncbi:Bax inhibitor-1/YccA family protein [Phototrophicus methaneseepsis]|uniref:Bax inhibitor-1/YccA family protein n=1 Tax=Phototrophicus methaneseepsis TaxID=2710758 RepID=A0A7S8EA59_9CHLR|nr:Bax inhibitor-1/YccA family protein [Phototrophicus methaneseepsis]QPC83212.1 Bax inhibitor-1/YccA family protein [Phototrophicus methaneseepsis]